MFLRAEPVDVALGDERRLIPVAEVSSYKCLYWHEFGKDKLNADCSSFNSEYPGSSTAEHDSPVHVLTYMHR